MLARLRSRLTYANVMSTIAVFGVLAGGTAYAANTIGSSDIIDESLLSQDLKNGEVKTPDVAANAINASKVLNNSLTSFDIQPESLSSGRIFGLDGTDIDNNSLTGADINEGTLSVAAMGCQAGKVQGFARIKGSASVPAVYTASTAVIDTTSNCSGGSVEVRRSSVGVYFVRFAGVSALLAAAISNSDGFGEQTTATDNVVSVSRITGGLDPGSFRVEVQGVNSEGSDPEDNQFTIFVM